MTLEDAVKACEIAPRKVKLKIIRYSVCSQRLRPETAMSVSRTVSLNGSTLSITETTSQ